MEKVKIACKVSFHEDKKFSRKHNARDYDGWNKDGHVNSDLTSRNVVLVDKDLREFFEDEFKEAIKEYNLKNQQKHPERVTTAYRYYEANRKMARECIIQLGDEESYQTLCAAVGVEQANQIHEKFFKAVYEHWQQDNPNLKIFGAYIHFDETTPHLHLDYLPIAEYKRGMTKKVSRDGALSKYKRGEKYGENKWTQWMYDERNTLEAIARSFDEPPKEQEQELEKEYEIEIVPHDKSNGKRTETYQWRQQAVDYYVSNPERPSEPIKPERKAFESKARFSERMQEYKQQKAEVKLWHAGEKIVVGRQDEQEKLRRQQQQVQQQAEQLQSECNKMEQTGIQLNEINQTLIKKDASLKRREAQLRAMAQQMQRQVQQQAQQLAQQMLQEQLRKNEEYLQYLREEEKAMAFLNQFLPEQVLTAPEPPSAKHQRGNEYDGNSFKNQRDW